jgi:hypothetical protein
VGAALPVTMPGVLRDAIMAWVGEAAEHAAQPQGRRPAGEAVPVFRFERLLMLGRQDAQLRADLDSAGLSVKEAAWQLAAISPDSPQWARAWQALGQAISQLLDVSTRLMEHDAVRAGGTEPVENLRQSNREIFVSRLDQALREQAAEASPDHLLVDPVGADTREALDLVAPVDDNRDVLNAEEDPAGWTILDRLLEHLDRAAALELGDPEDPAPDRGRIAPPF